MRKVNYKQHINYTILLAKVYTYVEKVYIMEEKIKNNCFVFTNKHKYCIIKERKVEKKIDKNNFRNTRR